MNSSPVLFREVQRFRQWWMWLVIVIGPLTIWHSTYRRFILGEHFGAHARWPNVGAVAADRDRAAVVVLQRSVDNRGPNRWHLHSFLPLPLVLLEICL